MEYIPAKTIIHKCTPNFNYLAVDYAMDLYRGCNHGCIYCYARSNYYEKTENFECIRAKTDALRIVRDELRRKVKKGIVHIGCVADPYNIEEKEHNLTGCALQLLNAFEFGVCMITKSNLVIRDTDILQDIRENAPVSINFSITCSDDEMGKKVEPFAATTIQRFEAVRHLADHGIVTGVLMDPVIPFLTDTEDNVREMVKKAKAYGASYIYMSPSVTMADIQRDFFYETAEKLVPGISQEYKKRYGNYYRCHSPKKRRLWNAFVEECEKEGINYSMKAANELIRRGYSEFQENFLHIEV